MYVDVAAAVRPEGVAGFAREDQWERPAGGPPDVLLLHPGHPVRITSVLAETAASRVWYAGVHGAEFGAYVWCAAVAVHGAQVGSGAVTVGLSLGLLTVGDGARSAVG